MPNRIRSTQINTQSFGKLQVNVTREIGGEPVSNASVRVYRMGSPNVLVYDLKTDQSGQTPVVKLPAPPLKYSMEPSNVLPYTEYAVLVSAPGLKNVEVYGTQVFPEVTAIQPVAMPPKDAISDTKIITIGPHELVGYHSPKIAEGEIKEMSQPNEQQVMIPACIIVHLSIPGDNFSDNVCDFFKDYIKNVVCNEIYPTWPEETIHAVILATVSFTLNRIYTDWYPKQGYHFHITNTSSFDNKWIYGRNYYDNISLAVDYLFHQYLARPGARQPVLTQYGNGAAENRCNMMDKWTAKRLGEEGYRAIAILRYFYGETLIVNTADLIANIVFPWSGYDLHTGMEGEKVRMIQNQINVIRRTYTYIPQVVSSGVYDEMTAEAVRACQIILGIPASGAIDFGTWYSLALLAARLSEDFDAGC